MKYTLSELATITNAELVGDPEYQITGVENLEAASEKEAAFLENPRYAKQLEASRAGVFVVHPTVQPVPGKNYLRTPHPSLTFQKLVELFILSPLSGFAGIHSTAVIHPEAVIGEGVSIGPYAVIDRKAVIGPNTRIDAHVFIGAETCVGASCHFYPKVIVREGCEIGNRVILQPGAVIGSCGFGYFTDNKGKHTPLKQVGKVVLEDDVEVGANSTIDRARFKVTRVCRGTKIDNLVQIGHQVELGADNLIVAQVGIAGSTKTGRNVVMGGQAGVAGHLEIGNGVMLAAKTGVSKSLTEPGVYAGAPAAPIKEAHTSVIHMKSLGKYIERIKALESKMAELEKQLQS